MPTSFLAGQNLVLLPPCSNSSGSLSGGAGQPKVHLNVPIPGMGKLRLRMVSCLCHAPLNDFGALCCLIPVGLPDLEKFKAGLRLHSQHGAERSPPLSNQTPLWVSGHLGLSLRRWGGVYDGLPQTPILSGPP